LADDFAALVPPRSLVRAELEAERRAPDLACFPPNWIPGDSAELDDRALRPEPLWRHSHSGRVRLTLLAEPYTEEVLASSILGNRQTLDGGAMFGNAPRALWSRWLTPDEHGLVELACRALLVEEPGKRTLFEAGIGAFFEPSLRERYGVVEETHVLLESLGALGLGERDIDQVVLSHLHFDHAGGILSPYRAKKPLELCFGRAEFVVGRRAFERAEKPHPRDQASFIRELPGLLRASGRLRIVESVDEAAKAVGEHFSFVETDGHTPGMLHATAHGTKAELLFCADMVPGTAWVHASITMGYDRYPEKLVDEKTGIFQQSMERRAYLVYTHDPRVAASRVRRDERGRFAPADPVGEFARWDLNALEAPKAA
jgi:glyoxylase-like metal-dependent hydrolase (beta-lactamase superfamily II)